MMLEVWESLRQGREDQRQKHLTEDLHREATLLIMKVLSNYKDTNLRELLKIFS